MPVIKAVLPVMLWVAVTFRFPVPLIALTPPFIFTAILVSLPVVVGVKRIASFWLPLLVMGV